MKKPIMIGLCASAFLTLLILKVINSSYVPDSQDKDIEIVFFAGGSKEDKFAPILVKGAMAAQKHLGCKLRIVWSHWDVDLMTKQFKEELEMQPDAICMMGHPGSERLTSFVQEAKMKKVVVTLQNVDIPELRNKYFSTGFGYVGQNLYNSGKVLAEALIRKYSLEPGQEAIVFQSYSRQDSTRGRRGRGAIDALEKRGLIVKSVDTPYEIALKSSTPEGRKFIYEQIASNKEAKALINDGILDDAPIVEALKTLGKKPGEMKYGAFDLSPASIKFTKEGFICILHDQQPFLQGYLSVLQAFMTTKYKFTGLYIDTGMGLIDDSSIDEVEDLVSLGLR